jgi:hypothetical protein
MKKGFAFYMWHAMKMQGYTAAAAAAWTAAAAAGWAASLRRSADFTREHVPLRLVVDALARSVR